jgi:hypothetical protein
MGGKGERARGRKGERAKGRKGERAKGRISLARQVTLPKNNIMKSIRHFRDFDVYQGAMALVMRVFELAKHLRRALCTDGSDQKVVSLGMRKPCRSMEKEAIPGGICL